MSGKQVYVFAYGSNMCTQRLRARAANAEPVATGCVLQRAFVFHKRSEDGSAKADAALSSSPADEVWGVVYRLSRAEKGELDEYEFLGLGYDEEQVDVLTGKGQFRAWMYVARRNVIDPSLLPYSWYVDYIIHGACQHKLPESYIDLLRRFDSQIDPDSARHATNRELLMTSRLVDAHPPVR